MNGSVGWVGRTLNARYRVEASLRAGGMGAVYRAVDLNMRDRPVVVKHPLRPVGGAANPTVEKELRKRFAEEVAKLIDLADVHGVVRIVDQGVEDGLPYYVMDFMAGGSLAERLEVRRDAPMDVVRWAKDVAETLDEIHARGLVHRDIKPANLLFRRAGGAGGPAGPAGEGRAQVADFGIVKELAAEWNTTGPQNTQIGTPGFMAPEQHLPDGVVSGATDQYALAATMYVALTGRPLVFETTGGSPMGRGAGAYRKRLRPVNAPDLAPHVPAAAAAAIAKGLEREPEDRFPSCRALVAAFEAGLQAPATHDGGRQTGGLTQTVRVLHSGGQAPGMREGGARGRRRGLFAALGLTALGLGAFLAADRLGWLPSAPTLKVPAVNPTPPPIPAPSTPPTPAPAPPVAKEEGPAVPEKPGWEQPLADAAAAKLFDQGEAVKSALARAEAAGVPEALVKDLKAYVAAWDAARTPTPLSDVPDWAKALVSKEQLAEAVRLKVPVAIEDERTKLRFVLIPGGTFTMGSPAGEFARDSNEGPQHQVTLSPFYLSVGEVTNAQYRRFKSDHDSGPGFNADDQPVVNVSHTDATAFAVSLGAGLSLPSEAQWEYAARAGTKTAYSFGDSVTKVLANLDRSAGTTTRAGTYPANPWGLYDMHGNVWEWCQDAYDSGFYGKAGATQKNPLNAGSPSDPRVNRGGGWNASAGFLRSAVRSRVDPSARIALLGFRLARAVTPR